MPCLAGPSVWQLPKRFVVWHRLLIHVLIRPNFSWPVVFKQPAADMKSTRVSNGFKWAATAVTLSGAVLASLDVYPFSAMVLNLGSALFLIWAVLIRDPAMITVNLGLLSIYTVGLSIKLF